MSENKSEQKNRKADAIKIHSFSKGILFYPIWIYSLIAIIAQASGNVYPGLAIGWIFVFFINLIIVVFDFPTIKFFILFLLIVLIFMTLILLDNAGKINLSAIWVAIHDFFDMSLEIRFYGWVLLTVGLVIIFAIIQGLLKYVKIEQNEIYFRGVTSGKLDRYPTNQVKIKMIIVDVFEFITLGAGTIRIHVDSDNIITMDTVPRVRKIKDRIDVLLSTTQVETKD